MTEAARISGRTLGHYRVLEQIAAGGMGVVYRAHDQRLERDVAIKVLPVGVLADEAARKRFRKEALAISGLNHPNICHGLRLRFAGWDRLSGYGADLRQRH